MKKIPMCLAVLVLLSTGCAPPGSSTAQKPDPDKPVFEVPEEPLEGEGTTLIKARNTVIGTWVMDADKSTEVTIAMLRGGKIDGATEVINALKTSKMEIVINGDGTFVCEQTANRISGTFSGNWTIDDEDYLYLNQTDHDGRNAEDQLTGRVINPRIMQLNDFQEYAPPMNVGYIVYKQE